MRLQYRLLRIVALTSIIFTLFSCSNKITREKAKDLIIKKFNFPITVTEKLDYGTVNYMNGGGTNLTAENKLIEEKLMTFKSLGQKRDMFFTYTSYFLDLTPEGMKFKIGETTDYAGTRFYEMKVAEKIFLEITGIIEINDGKAARIDYNWRYANITPFGEAFSLRNQQINEVVYNGGKVYSEQVMMIKYDDGWRIQE